MKDKLKKLFQNNGFMISFYTLIIGAIVIIENDLTPLVTSTWGIALGLRISPITKCVHGNQIDIHK